MAGDSLRASAPTAAPSEGTTSFPSSFAFRRSPHFSDELFRSHATITSGDYFSVAAEISEEDPPVLFARNVGTLRSVIRMTPEQARAVAAELLAAADALQPCEDAPQATSASNTAGA